jgi:hypothetical protein
MLMFKPPGETLEQAPGALRVARRALNKFPDPIEKFPDTRFKIPCYCE